MSFASSTLPGQHLQGKQLHWAPLPAVPARIWHRQGRQGHAASRGSRLPGQHVPAAASEAVQAAVAADSSATASPGTALVASQQQQQGTVQLPPWPKSVWEAIIQPVQALLSDKPLIPGRDADAVPIMEQTDTVVLPLLPEKNLGILRGGQYPFTYDPVYGLPVVNDVWGYSKVLRGIREGRVQQILWFQEVNSQAPVNQRVGVSGRCLVRLRDGKVAQSVVPQEDVRMQEAMQAHGVAGVLIPVEPRHVVGDDAPYLHPYARWYTENVAFMEQDAELERRGPRVGPTEAEMVMSLPEFKHIKDAAAADQATAIKAVLNQAVRMDTEDWEAYQAAGPSVGSMGREEVAMLEASMGEREEGKKSWMDNIIVSQETQALIVRYVPILGPILGSAFIIGLYMLSRLVKGDLTDRMNMMNQEEDKRKRQQLKEVRIAFLEEELPALVAKGASLEEVKKKSANINSRLGSKLEISEGELVSTYEACMSLLESGTDLSGAAGSESAASRMLAEQEAKEAEAARKAAQSEGGEGGGQSEMDALMEMGKLNTARIRKATDPRIMEVKRRVRQARRNMKRESKVQLSDEIIFFDDVAGNEQAKIELLEIVDFFRQPQKFRSSGARAPKGVLLVGPPGNGKTLMARAVAGESGVAFISSSASEFIEMYMGLGAARVRDVFQTARKLAPCIIFIDELDAVGRQRRGGGAGNDERDNTVNQLLTELDGFEAEQQGIVVMGATNRKDVLDAALTRPGRFDRSIEVRRPDFSGRLEGVKVHLRDKPIASDVDYKELALLTGGMSGAQLAGMCNIASFVASREGHTEITQTDLVKAVEQSKYGRTVEAHRFVSPARKRRLAVMEAGISVAACLLPAIEPIDYTTAVPSAKSPVGRTVLTSDVGRYTTGMWTQRYLRDQLQLALAGRAAEELVYGFEELSSLHQHRVMLARQIATKMLNAGMSSHPDFQNLRTLGDQYYEPSSEPGRFTLYTMTHDNNQSRSEWIDIDMELEAMLNNSYAQIKELLSRNRAAVDRVVDMLLEHEKVPGTDIQEVVQALGVPEDVAQKEQAKELAML